MDKKKNVQMKDQGWQNKADVSCDSAKKRERMREKNNKSRISVVYANLLASNCYLLIIVIVHIRFL